VNEASAVGVAGCVNEGYGEEEEPGYLLGLVVVEIEGEVGEGGIGGEGVREVDGGGV